jgi:hypothetical protein
MTDNIPKKTILKVTELDKPQYNSTLKLMKKLDEIQINKKDFILPNEELEKIHEKVDHYNITQNLA